MKKSLICLMVLLIAGPTFAKGTDKKMKRNPASKLQAAKIKCLADQSGADRIEIPLQQTMGAAPEKKTDYKGHKIAAGFSPGDQYESQQVLVLEVNGFSSTIYDPKQSLYMLTAPTGVKIQCYAEQ